jgi:hypothetical protein
VIALFARRSFASWATTIGGSLSAAYLLHNVGWRGNWQGGLQAVSTAMVFLLVSLTWAAAVDCRRLTLFSAGPGMCRSSPLGRMIVMLSGTWIWGVLWVTCLVFATIIVNLRTASFEFPGLGSIILPYAWLSFYAASGFAIGQAFPRLASPVVAVLVAFLSPVLLSSAPDTRWALLTPIDDGADSPPIFLRQSVMLGQAGIILLAGAAILCALASSKKWYSGHSRWRFVAATCALAGMSLALFLSLDPDRRFVAQNASGPRVCGGDDGSVCVWAPHRFALQSAATVWASLRNSLPDWAGKPTGISEPGLESPPGFAKVDISAVPPGDGMAWVISGAVVARLYCDQSWIRSGGARARQELLLYWSGLLPAGPMSPQTARMLTKSEARQHAWWIMPWRRAQCAGLD